LLPGANLNKTYILQKMMYFYILKKKFKKSQQKLKYRSLHKIYLVSCRDNHGTSRIDWIHITLFQQNINLLWILKKYLPKMLYRSKQNLTIIIIILFSLDNINVLGKLVTLMMILHQKGRSSYCQYSVSQSITTVKLLIMATK